MTAAQRAHRLRQIDRRRDALAVELRGLNAEAQALENEQSRAMGYGVPLRGKRLLDAIDREARAAA